MSHNDTILVIVDPKARHHAAIAKGALLAKKYQARMDLLSWGSAGLETEVSAKLRNLTRFLRANGLDVSTEVVPEDLIDAALAERLHGARLVIKDAAQTTRLQRPALTAIDSELARVCAAPLLLSKPKLWPELPLICAAVDPGQREQPWPSLSDAVMEEGKILANRLDGQLHVLHTHAPSGSMDPLEAVEPWKERAADQYVAGLRMFVTRLAGNVFVMGSTPRKWEPGEVADMAVANLLQQIPCDLLVVKAAQATNTLH